MTTAEALEWLREPRKIWAPNGWTFMYQTVDNPDIKKMEDVFDAGFLRHELTGPNDETNLFIFDSKRQLLDLPNYEDLPRSYPIIAGIALRAYEGLSEEALSF